MREASRGGHRLRRRDRLSALEHLGASRITREGDEVEVHAHLVVGLGDGTTRGGHLLEAHVRPTLEIMLSESPETLERRFDERFGIPLIALDAPSR